MFVEKGKANEEHEIELRVESEQAEVWIDGWLVAQFKLDGSTRVGTEMVQLTKAPRWKK